MIHTPVCDALGIKHPIVLAGMGGGATNAELVAAVSEAGGLGTLGCIQFSADEAVEEIRRIRSLTNRPFSVNFVLHLLDEEAFRACLAERVPVFTFFRGDPAEAVARAHDVGAITMNQITTVQEAERACEVGVDVLIAQGCEAGGHMGPIPLLSLLPEVVAVAGSRPVLAAGGIVDGRGMAAALCLGASGVVMGTRFLASPEAPVSPAYKRAILNAKLGDTVASRIWEVIWDQEWPGVQLRVIRNELTKRWIGREDELRAAVATVYAEVEHAGAVGDPAFMPLYAGEGAGRIREIEPAAQVVREVVAEAEQIIRGVNGLVR